MTKPKEKQMDLEFEILFLKKEILELKYGKNRDKLSLRYNQNHDPGTGRFTSGSGGGSDSPASVAASVSSHTIAESKITDYCLKPGSKHYADFADVGFTPSDGDLLKAQFAEAFTKGERVDIRSGYNDSVLFSVFANMGKTSQKRFRIVWQIDNGIENARFITAYREDDD